MPDIDRSKVTLGVAISSGVYLIIQTVVVTWWAAGVSTNLQNLKDTVANGTANRYTSIDALRDKQIIEQRENGIETDMKSMVAKIEGNTQGITTYYAKHGELEKKQDATFATTASNHDSILSIQARERFDDEKRTEQNLKLGSLEARVSALENRK